MCVQCSVKSLESTVLPVEPEEKINRFVRKSILCGVEPPKKGQFGNGTFVLSLGVVLTSEVHEIRNFTI